MVLVYGLKRERESCGFTREKPQLSKSEVEMTRQLARVRIHVECVIVTTDLVAPKKAFPPGLTISK